MQVIAALINRADERGAIRSELDGLAGVDFSATVEALSRAANGAIAGVVTQLRDPMDTPVAPVLVTVNHAHPTLPVFIALIPTEANCRDLLAASVLGVRAELVIRPHEPYREAVGAALGQSYVRSAGMTLLRRLLPRAPVLLHPFLTVAVFKPCRRGVNDAAEWSGTRPRTLHWRLRQAGLPPAAAMLGSCRFLQAAWHLDVQNWTIKRVVAAMGLASGSSLTNLFHHYGRCTPSTLREQGGFPAMLERCERDLFGGGEEVSRISS